MIAMVSLSQIWSRTRSTAAFLLAPAGRAAVIGSVTNFGFTA
ncbi:hypothetical protein OOK41_00045 [Micromonospora sp. NBC_01655]|nr:hypothetical protein [Micromonospora sp. NBC_01655]MCX4468721.1 hypothetical protein [Micromonospora sp. NBC_01655]